jgi:hypothetical protein
MIAAVEQAIKAGDIKRQDVATVALAKMYAAAVDRGELEHGPKLLAALTALGCTPAGRRIQQQADGSSVGAPPATTTVVTGGPTGGEPVVNPLAVLRDDRTLRETGRPL